MQHNMHLTDVPFKQVREGTKTIESRLFDEKRKQISPGDEIIFHLQDDPAQQIKTKVMRMYTYGSFEELLGHVPIAMFGGDSEEEVMVELRGYYSEAEEKQYGVVGIEIIRID